MKPDCRQVRYLLPDFLRPELSPFEANLVRNHLDACGRCREALAGLEGMLDVIAEKTSISVSGDFVSRVAARAEVLRPLANPRTLLGPVARRRVNIWGAAVVVHAAAILLLAFFYIPYRAAQTQVPIELEAGCLPAWESSETFGLWDDFTPPEGKIDPTTGLNADILRPAEPLVADSGNPFRPEWAFPKVTGRGIDSPDFTRRIERMGGRVSAWFSTRLDAKKKDAARARAGADRTAPRLHKALAFLASRQNLSDGSFSMDGARSSSDYETGVAGLALLAFLGDGHCRIRGTWRHTVARGIEFLIEHQNPDTGLVGPEKGHYMYNHAIATTALLECYGLEKNANQRRPALAYLRGAAGKALAYLLAAANGSGAFGYTPSDRHGDTSVTAWALSALELSRGLDMVPADLRPAFNKVRKGVRSWLRSVTDSRGRVGYRGRGSVKTYPESMTAVGLYCAGVMPDLFDRQTRRAQADLLGAKPPGPNQRPDFYFWYYASTALHRAGGVRFASWDAPLRSALAALQKEDGGFGHRTAYGATGGRVYTTALAALMMEVYFRRG
jgi:hypothetical protein